MLTVITQQASRTSPSLQALTACFTSACDTLKIVSADFAKISMLVSSLSNPHDIFLNATTIAFSATAKTLSQSCPPMLQSSC